MNGESENSWKANRSLSPYYGWGISEYIVHLQSTYLLLARVTGSFRNSYVSPISLEMRNPRCE